MNHFKYLLYVILILGSILYASPVIIHDKIDDIVVNQPIMFNIELRDFELNSINSVEVFYKTDTDFAFTSVVMNLLPPNYYNANITPILNDATQFQYYFVVKMNDGTKYTLPQIYPEDNSYYANIKRSEKDPKVKLITPMNKSSISDGTPVIMVSYEDPYSILDLSTVSLKIDGKNTTSESQIFKNFTQYIPDQLLSEESHTIEFSVKDKAGVSYPINSTFLYQTKKPSLVSYKGDYQLYYDLYNTNKDASVISREPSKLRHTFDMNLKSGWLNSDINIYNTSEEAASTQKQNRNSISLYDDTGYFKLNVGDSSPVLSNYSMNGVNVDGVDAVVSWPGILSLTYINGYTKRAILGNETDTSNIINGTFAQKVTALQLYNKFFGLETALTFADYKDDKDSLLSTQNWGTTLPQENIVFSLFNKLNFDDLTYLKMETAGEVFYSDISSTSSNITLTSNPIPDWLTNIVPIRSTMQLPQAASMLELGMPIFVRDVYFKAFTNLAMQNFQSFGNSSIKADNFAYGDSIRVNVLNNNVSFTGAYQKSQNNTAKLLGLDGQAPYTTFGDDFKAGTNMNLWGVANFGYNYSLSLQKNDATPTDNDNFINNQTQTHLFTLTNMKIEYGKFVGKLNTNYNIVSYQDAVNSGNNFIQNGIGLAIDTEYDPVKIKLSFTNSIKDNQGPTESYTVYNTYGIRADYEYIPKIMTVYGGYSLQTGLNNGNDTTKVVNNSKTILSGGLLYKMPGMIYNLFYDSKFFLDYSLTLASDSLSPGDNTKNFNEQLITFRFTTTF